MNDLTSNSTKLTLKDQYLELITQGYVENVALDKLNIPKGAYLLWLSQDTDFNNKLTEARKLRADFWVSKVVSDIDNLPEAKDVPAERLRFDKLVFLAKADNPDKFGNNSKKLDISIDLSQFKLLPPDEALKALAEDPFAPKVIEAEFEKVEDKDLL